MLRVLYGLILRAHPPYFRQRFQQEMQGIFEQVETPRDEIGMLADAVVSLARQWTLRPRFWEPPTLPMAGQAGLLFSSLDSHKPRAAALVYGAFLSALVLNGVCWTMGYAWNHPIFIELRRPLIPPPATWNAKSTSTAAPEEKDAVETERYTNEGRVVLIFTMHPRAAKASAENAENSVPTGLPSSTASSSEAPMHRIHSYVGTYIASPGQEKVNVALANGALQVEVVGVFSSRLVPTADPDAMICSGRECQVNFSPSASGNIDRVHIRYGEREVLAFRLQGAVF